MNVPFGLGTMLLAGDNIVYLNFLYVLFNNTHRRNQPLKGMFKEMEEEILMWFQQAEDIHF